MPVSITDPLSLDAHELDVSVPVDADDPSKGTVTVRIREIPYAKWQSLVMERAAAAAAVSKGYLAMQESPTPAAASALAEACVRRRESDLAILRWGVCGHRAEDFYIDDNPVPFESEETEFLGVRYQLASQRMLRLYMLAGGGRNHDESTLAAQISRAIEEFQTGKVRGPEEVWAEAAKKKVKSET